MVPQVHYGLMFLLTFILQYVCAARILQDIRLITVASSCSSHIILCGGSSMSFCQKPNTVVFPEPLTSPKILLLITYTF